MVLVLGSIPGRSRGWDARVLRNGEDSVDVVYDLMRYGSYYWDVANAIVSAAYVAYCSDVNLLAPGYR